MIHFLRPDITAFHAACSSRPRDTARHRDGDGDGDTARHRDGDGDGDERASQRRENETET